MRKEGHHSQRGQEEVPLCQVSRQGVLQESKGVSMDGEKGGRSINGQRDHIRKSLAEELRFYSVCTGELL